MRVMEGGHDEGYGARGANDVVSSVSTLSLHSFPPFLPCT